MSNSSTTSPRHVAFIMDGNRRYAKQKGINPLHGHLEGENRIEPLIDHAIEAGISHLTFWAFSTENWQRSEKEVEFLLTMFRTVLEKRINAFHKKNVRLIIIGNLRKFPSDIQDKARSWMEKTKDNTKIIVNVALSYGGRDELVRAVNKISSRATITADDISNNLDTAGQPDPDLLIRTGGEQRLSGFLLWQLEYAELYFTDVLWPQFTPEEFQKALVDFQNRQRRFGK